MPIIVIASSKGGTGKSSMTLQLIHHLKPDLVVDADIHKGIINLLSLGDNAVCVKHAQSVKELASLCKDESLFILIDCGGFDSDVSRYAISQSDFILTPTNDDPTEQFALIEFNKVIKQVSKTVNEKLTAHIILNRVYHSRKDFVSIDNLLEQQSNLERVPFVIPHSSTVSKHAFTGSAIPSGAIAGKFNLLAKYILNNIN